MDTFEKRKKHYTDRENRYYGIFEDGQQLFDDFKQRVGENN